MNRSPCRLDQTTNRSNHNTNNGSRSPGPDDRVVQPPHDIALPPIRQEQPPVSRFPSIRSKRYSGQQSKPWRADVMMQRPSRRAAALHKKRPFAYPKHILSDAIVEEEDDDDIAAEEYVPTDEEGSRMSSGGGGGDSDTAVAEESVLEENHMAVCLLEHEHSLQCYRPRVWDELKKKLKVIYTGHFEVFETVGLGLRTRTLAAPMDIRDHYYRQQYNTVLRELKEDSAPDKSIFAHRTPRSTAGLDKGGVTKEQMQDSFALFEQWQRQKEQTQEEWEEYTVQEESIAQQPIEDDEWTEYTVEESVNVASADEQLAKLDAILANKQWKDSDIVDTDHQVDDDEMTEYTEVTIEEGNTEQDQQERLAAILATKAQASAHADTVTPQPDDDEWTEYTIEEADTQKQQERLDQILAEKQAVTEEAEELEEDMGPTIEIAESFESCNEFDDDELTNDDDYTEITMTESQVADPVSSPFSLGRGTFAPSEPEQVDEDEEGFTIHLQMNPSPRKMDSITDETDALSDDDSTAYTNAREEFISGSTTPGSPSASTMSSASSSGTARLLRQDVWSADPSIVNAALTELAAVARRGRAERTTIVQYGGLLAIVRALQSHREENADVVIAGCQCLTEMASAIDNRCAIGQVGGVDAVVNGMQSHSGNVLVQEAGSVALASLTKDGAVNQLACPSAVPTLSSSMKNFANNSRIQESAFAALASLSLENSERLRQLSESGGMTAMTAALQRPWKDASAKHEAISTLSILLRSLATDQIQ